MSLTRTRKGPETVVSGPFSCPLLLVHRGPYRAARQNGPRMFFFFSNRLGCVGSLLLSAVLTLLLVGVLLLVNGIL